MALDYATTTQLIARFEDELAVAHLTDNADEGTPDTSVLTDILEAAETFINGYLGRKYLIPIEVAGDKDLIRAMREVTLDIAQYRLLSRGDFVSEAKLRMYNEAVAWLKDIATGKAVLPAPGVHASTTSRSPVMRWGVAGEAGGTESNRVFTRENQGGL